MLSRRKGRGLPPLIVILGPTASGKTKWGIKLARKFNGEVVSADSRQLYRGMDIGTAKPKDESRDGKFYAEGIRHHLIDVRWPDEPMTLVRYQNAALKAIDDIHRRGKLPFLVGGTGLYIQAITENLKIPPIPPNPTIRVGLARILKREGLAPLWEKLLSLDPEAAYIVDSKNPRRVIRALEVTMLSGRAFSKLRRRAHPPFRTLKIGILRERGSYLEGIRERTKKMLSRGLIQEVKRLLRGYPSDLEVFDAIGYREAIAHAQGKISLEECERLITRNTKRFSRHQMTWFKRDKDIQWMQTPQEAARLIKNFLAKVPATPQ